MSASRAATAAWWGAWLLLFMLIGAACRAAAGPPEAAAAPPVPTLRPTAVPPARPTGDHGTGRSRAETSAAAELKLDSETEAFAPTPAPDLSITPEVNLTATDLEVQSGSALNLSGRVRLREDQNLEAVVIAPNGRLVAAARVSPGSFNTWQTSLALPLTFSGQAAARITVFNPDGEGVMADTTPVLVRPDTNQDRYLALYRPALDRPAEGVAGTYLFFDGYAQQPVGFRVAIAILDEGCRQQVNRQSYALRGSGYWQGFIVIPVETIGDVCAVVSFGEEGSPERREVQLPLAVVPAEGRDAVRVVIGNPPPGSRLAAGRTVKLYGTAANAPEGVVHLALRLADGTIAATEIATTDRYGYWESSLLVPGEISGDVELRATLGPPGSPVAQDVLMLEIVDE